MLIHAGWLTGGHPEATEETSGQCTLQDSEYEDNHWLPLLSYTCTCKTHFIQEHHPNWTTEELS